MRKYTQLTGAQRYQIYGLKKSGWKQVQIAAEIGVHPSTISKELTRNRGERGRRPAQAQRMRDARRQGAVNGKRFSLNDWVEVGRLIRQDFSPEQVAERIELEGGFQISHGTIYRRIYKDKRAGSDLWRHLRCQKPHRKRYASGQEWRGAIKNRISIDYRPEIVAQRVRIGDWEGDTVIGKSHQGVLVTLAERKSRYVLAGALPSKHAEGVTAKINSLLRPHQDKCHRVTFDNGKEFADHASIAAELKVDIYFAHPYRSWERGLNENSNGLHGSISPRGWR